MLFFYFLLFGIIDFIRGIILTGFPWNLIVYSLSENLNFINIISVIRTYSLNLIVISFYTTQFFTFSKVKQRDNTKYYYVGFTNFIYHLRYISKKEFLNNELKENPFTVRIIGSNIGLERFYDNTQTEDIINELVKISSPEKEKKYFLYGLKE